MDYTPKFEDEDNLDDSINQLGYFSNIGSQYTINNHETTSQYEGYSRREAFINTTSQNYIDVGSMLSSTCQNNRKNITGITVKYQSHRSIPDLENENLPTKYANLFAFAAEQIDIYDDFVEEFAEYLVETVAIQENCYDLELQRNYLIDEIDEC